ncbi:hypothetical protein FEM48_Zijuj11G0140500 [Ziziphus jujuba var. spinosa]|uniref:Uncharacterized protein n=1 Tax=Ziziphus jujuba var. spinosa TaxID=714518 RepID=A0A978UJD1_ZIZJJ|nr:hypothetical protein FEM48_Zijuj11G0140500 [Ziziphus jujuba var. spinosa]
MSFQDRCRARINRYFGRDEVDEFTWGGHTVWSSRRSTTTSRARLSTIRLWKRKFLWSVRDFGNIIITPSFSSGGKDTISVASPLIPNSLTEFTAVCDKCHRFFSSNFQL